MLFMSAEHVAAMNAVLEDDPAVRAACAALPRPRVMSYRLAEGPGGETVHWTTTFSDTARFSLEEHPSPDIVFVGGWAQMVRASKASRDGEAIDPGVTVEGDPSLLAEIGPVLEVARGVATLPVDFPEV